MRRAVAVAVLAVVPVVHYRYEVLEKRVAVVSPGRLVRGAWQRPWPLRRIIDREGIKTIVTLTAINSHDPKYVDQERVVKDTGVDWIIVPMRGSTATIAQLVESADLLADPDRQPVFFHCVAGHHRTNLAMAAYRIRYDGWSADRAWDELLTFPWTRPEQDADDRRLIEAFAAVCRREPGSNPLTKETRNARSTDAPMDGPAGLDRPAGDGDHDRLAMGVGQSRHGDRR